MSKTKQEVQRRLEEFKRLRDYSKSWLIPDKVRDKWFEDRVALDFVKAFVYLDGRAVYVIGSSDIPNCAVFYRGGIDKEITDEDQLKLILQANGYEDFLIASDVCCGMLFGTDNICEAFDYAESQSDDLVKRYDMCRWFDAVIECQKLDDFDKLFLIYEAAKTNGYEYDLAVFSKSEKNVIGFKSVILGDLKNDLYCDEVRLHKPFKIENAECKVKPDDLTFEWQKVSTVDYAKLVQLSSMSCSRGSFMLHALRKYCYITLLKYEEVN